MGCGSSSTIDTKNDNLKKSKVKKPPVRESGKTVSYKGITILDNIQKFIPGTITRDEIKNMVYESLEIGDLKGKSKGKLTEDKIEAIIDLLMKVISGNSNDLEDKRLDDIKAVIGFYDVNEENIKKLFFKNEKPTKEQIEEKYNKLASQEEDAKIFAIELENE